MKPRILIPIVHVPSEKHWRHPEITIPALRLVPHYTTASLGAKAIPTCPRALDAVGLKWRLGRATSSTPASGYLSPDGRAD